MKTAILRCGLAGLFLALLAAAHSALRADEGMWLFNNPPRKLLKERTTSSRPTSGSSTCRSLRSASTAAAPGRSCRPTAWS